MEQSKGKCRAVGYVRVSTEEQAAEGVSLDAQRAKIEGWCRLNDFDLIEVYADEGLSAKRADNRPGLQSALDRVCRDKAALVILKLDRMIRSTRDAIDIAERLRRSNADLVSLSERIDTTSPMGEFFYVLMAAMAQLERRQVGERTRLAMSHLRSQGKRTSRFAEFGYRHGPDGELVADPHEQEAVALIREWRSQGWSYNRIGIALAERQFTGRRQQQLSAKVIRAIVKRRVAKS